MKNFNVLLLVASMLFLIALLEIAPTYAQSRYGGYNRWDNGYGGYYGGWGGRPYRPPYGGYGFYGPPRPFGRSNTIVIG